MKAQSLFNCFSGYKKVLLFFMCLFFAYALAFSQSESISFHEGYAKITQKGKSGFIDKAGKI